MLKTIRLYELTVVHSFDKIFIKNRVVFMNNVLLLDKRTQGLITDYVPNDEVLNDLVGFFTIFSDYTRLKMISALAISEMCVSDLSNLLKLNHKRSLYFHLN